MPFIMLTVLIDMLSVGLIIPVLPTLVGRFTSSPTEQVAWYGVIAFTYGFAQFVASPVLGALSDRYGRRPVLLIGFCGLAINFFVTAMAAALWMLIASRLVGGAMQANAAVANAYVADISSRDDRAKRFGMLGAMFGIGFMLGPVLGGLLGAIDLQLPFFVAGALALANLAYGWWVLPESLPRERRRPVALKALNPVASLYGLARLKGVGLLVAVIACAGLAQFILYTVWVLHGSLKFGWGPKESGWSLFVIGVMSVLVQGFLLGKLLKVFSPQRLALLGLLSSTVAFALWGAAWQSWVVFAVIVANVFGFTTASSIQSIVSSAADASQQGEAMGAVSSLNSLMAVLAPMIATPLLGAVSHFPQGDWRIGAPLYFCAALQAVSLALAWLHFRSSRHTVSEPPGAPASS
ncbi:MFS transporter [uncultured Piscinibacter sp.]|uniref:MFS transporter n=1 Tax=uncultured Piscinibacter sp. TaxID=1131835 RepID=UPI0026353BAC|nr:MFS transporter [uncultured Piscinibacter sp.]